MKKIAGIDTEELLEKASKILTILLDSTFIIPKNQYLNIIMEEWLNYCQIEKKEIMQVFKKYDTNSDGVLSLSEFEVLIKDIDPHMAHTDTIKLFMNVLLLKSNIKDIISIKLMEP